MAAGDGLIGFFENIFRASSAILRSSPDSYCDLETSLLGSSTLVNKNGALCTLFKIEGAMGMVGRDEFADATNKLHTAMTGYMSSSGHSMGFFFEYDPQQTGRRIDELLQPSLAASVSAGLDVSDVFVSSKNELLKYCAEENCYLAVYTDLSGTPKDIIKKEAKERYQYSVDNKVPLTPYAQNLFAIYESITSRHDAIVSSLSEDFRSVGVLARVLDKHEALRVARHSIVPDSTDRKWRASLPGDPLMRMAIESRNNKRDMSHAFYPRVSAQLVPENLDYSLRGGERVQIGGRHYGTLVMSRGPQQIEPFLSFFSRAREFGGIPWRMSYSISADGLKALSVKRIIVSIFGFLKGPNMMMRDAFKGLEELEHNGEAIVAMRCSLTTWANSESELQKNKAVMSRAIQSWGASDASDQTGVPQAAFFSTVPCFTRRNPAPVMAPPLSDAIRMTPILSRPASPWANGSTIFRTPDGKIFPMQPGSSLQDSWVNLLYATMGSGKSALLNKLNLSACVSPGVFRLPFILIVDVGPSSSGLVSLLQGALPENLRHQAGYFKMQMSKEYAVNPFDTQLGARYPNPMERAYLVNLIGILATPSGEQSPYDGATDMAGLMIDEIYKRTSDGQSETKLYSRNIEPLVDEAIQEIGAQLDEHTSWWEIVDALFMAGHIHHATLAQRHAVPILADLMGVVKSPVIMDTFASSENSSMHIKSGERLVEAMSRIISTAVREYPVISNPTKFDIGDCRVASIDLNDVARGEGAAGKKQAAIMFMLARQIGAKTYYLSPEFVRNMPEHYRKYHEQRIFEIKDDIKSICFDEFHRTGGIQSLRDMVLMDIREGRKWRVMITLASQFLEDFDPNMINAASSVYIMTAGNSQMREQAKKVFGLSDTEIAALDRHCHGPSPKGANFLGIFQTKAGRVSQILTSTVGAVEKWAFSTTTEDVSLRRRLYESMPARKARALLSAHFPDGTVRPEVERRSLESSEGRDIIKEIADEIIRADISSRMVLESSAAVEA